MSFNRVLIVAALLFSTLHATAQVNFEIAPLSVYDGTLASQRDCIVDVNGDYLDDIVIIITNSLIIYFQQPDGTFERTEYPVAGGLNASWNAFAADFNEDGITDIGVGSSSRLVLAMSDTMNNSFVLEQMPDPFFVQRTSAIDLDLDGDLDIFSCNDDAINHVFENLGNGEFELNIDMLPTVDLAGNYSHVWSDYDNDGDSDLQISKCYAATTSVNDPESCLLYTSPSPRDQRGSRMPSSA